MNNGIVDIDEDHSPHLTIYDTGWLSCTRGLFMTYLLSMASPVYTVARRNMMEFWKACQKDVWYLLLISFMILIIYSLREIKTKNLMERLLESIWYYFQPLLMKG